MRPRVWLGAPLDLSVMRHAIEVVGAPGVGKSLMLKAFRASIAHVMKSHPHLRIKLIDFDPKKDLDDLFSMFPSSCPIFDLDPFVWGDVYDLVGGEVADPRDINEMFSLFIDVSTNQTQTFFPLSARDIGGSLTTRHWLECPDVTTFADIVRSCSTPDNMRKVARSHPLTRGLLSLLQDNEAGLSIMATLAMEMRKFSIPAALYGSNTTGRKVSSKTLMSAPRCVIKLPFNLKSVATLSPLTRLFVSRAQQRVLTALERDTIVPVILDEMSLLPGGLDLSTGSVFGRECGWCPIYTYQSHAATEKAFGKANLESTLSTTKTVIAFRVVNPQDAEITAKKFGSFEGFIRSHSGSESAPTGLGSGSKSWSWSDSFQTVQNVTPGMLMSLPIPTPNYPFIEYYMVTVGSRPAHFKIAIADIVKEFFGDIRPTTPLPPRSPKDMILMPWDKATDYPRLKLPEDDDL